MSRKAVFPSSVAEPFFVLVKRGTTSSVDLSTPHFSYLWMFHSARRPALFLVALIFALGPPFKARSFAEDER